MVSRNAQDSSFKLLIARDQKGVDEEGLSDTVGEKLTSVFYLVACYNQCRVTARRSFIYHVLAP